MWKTYQRIAFRYPRLSLDEERCLIAEAQRPSKEKTEELVLRHIGFIIYRIHKRAFPAYISRFGEDILSQAIFVLYDKISSYDLNYRDRHGNHKPVRFSSYIWKRIDGLIIDSLKKETKKERCQFSPDWERYEADVAGGHNI